jgi:peptidoglycan/LPS O-acetylase OafA/YrhL
MAGTAPLPPADRFPALDSLRGVAALMVYWHHTGTVLTQSPFVVYGSSGVYLFFALSGYLLSRPFLAATLSRRPTPAVGRYLARRLARILPPYWVSLVVFTALRYAAGKKPPDAENFLTHLGLVFNYWPAIDFYSINVVFWTLAIEVQFYLLLPLLVLAGRALGRTPSTRAMAAVALTLGVGVVGRTTEWSLWPELYGEGAAVKCRSVFSYLDLFGWGMLAALLELRLGHALDRLAVWGGAAAVGVGLVLAANNLAHESGVGSGWQESADPACALGYPPLIGAGMAALVLAARSGPVERSALGRCRGLRFCGTISYSIYLYHMAIQLVGFTLLARLTNGGTALPAWAASGFVPGLLFLPGTLLACWVLYRLVERPSLALAARFRVQK